MSNLLLLLSGIPASGKTNFGRWLASEKSFIHYDVEHDQTSGRLAGAGLLRPWYACFQTGDALPLVEALRNSNRPIVWDWGFPVQSLPIVEVMKRAGFTLWWFDADPSTARAAFLARGDAHIATIS